MRSCLTAIFLLLLASCMRSASPEQSVYEAIWSGISVNRPTKPIAATTDSRWFLENELSNVVANGMQARGGEEAWLKPEYVPLLEELYRVNKRNEPLGWRPTDKSATVLEGNFLSKPRDEEVQARCLVPTGKKTVGVADASLSRSYRPYYSFSRVAFSRDGSLAMVKYGLACAPLSGGHEAFAILKHVGDDWVLVVSRLLWIS